MKIRLRPLGPFRQYLGRQELTVFLAEGATVAELMRAIDDRWGEVLPSHLWDHERRVAKPSVIFLVEGRRVEDVDAVLLADGQQVLVTRVVAGG